MNARLNCVILCGCVHVIICFNALPTACIFALKINLESTLVHFLQEYVLLQEPVNPNDQVAAHNVSNFKAELIVSLVPRPFEGRRKGLVHTPLKGPGYEAKLTISTNNVTSIYQTDIKLTACNESKSMLIGCRYYVY